MIQQLTKTIRPIQEISRFSGIIITMQAGASDRSKPPRIHAQYNNDAASYEVRPDDVVKVDGHMNIEQEEMVQVWADIRRVELQSAWNFMAEGNWKKGWEVKPLK